MEKSIRLSLLTLLKHALILLLPVFILTGCRDDNTFTSGDELNLKSAVIAENGSVVFWGPMCFTRTKGKPNLFSFKTAPFDAAEFEAIFRLKIENGCGTSLFVSNASVVLDGVQLFAPRDFEVLPEFLEKEVALKPTGSTLEITLRGEKDTQLKIWVEGTPLFDDTFTDERDGHVYRTVKIGNQVWMAENLAWLPEVSPPTIGSFNDPYYYVYDYNGYSVAEAKATYNYKTYGVLYNWHAANLAVPDGWRLPDNDDWMELITFAGGYNVAGGMLKETGTTHWCADNVGATDEFGFTALPGGWRRYDNIFEGLSYNAYFWSLSPDAIHPDIYKGMACLAFYQPHILFPIGQDMDFGLSVRCIKK